MLTGFHSEHCFHDVHGFAMSGRDNLCQREMTAFWPLVDEMFVVNKMPTATKIAQFG